MCRLPALVELSFSLLLVVWEVADCPAILVTRLCLADVD